MTSARKTTLLIIAGFIIAFFLFEHSTWLGYRWGWSDRKEYDQNYVELKKEDGVPVVPSHLQVIVERDGGRAEIPADAGRYPRVTIEFPDGDSERSGRREERPAPSRPARSGNHCNGSGCDSDGDGFKPIVIIQNN